MKRFPKGLRTWVVLFCVLWSAQKGNAQFVDVTSEVEFTPWGPGGVATRTTVHCVVGTNSWEIDSEFSSHRKSWFTGTKIVESFGPWFVDSPDGNPGFPAGQSDRLQLPERIAWLAFCSAPCLKRSEHKLFPPGDLWKEMMRAPSGFSERMAVIESSGGLPRSVELSTSKDQPVLQFWVTATTNVLGREFPLEFSLAQYRPAFLPGAFRMRTNGWELDLTAKGKVTSIGVGAIPQVPDWIEKAAQRR